MHDLPALAGGADRCTLHIHPEQHHHFGIDGGEAVVGATAARS